MDTSEQYIFMMRRNHALLLHKWEKGFNEGDYIYDGKSVHVLGHDYICVSQHFKKYPEHHILRLALYEPLSAVTYIADTSPTCVEVKDGKYGLHQLNNAIWLPRQDQLQEMVDFQTCINDIQVLLDFASSDSVSSLYHHNNIPSMEQFWLAYVMFLKFNKRWNGEDWVHG